MKKKINFLTLLLLFGLIPVCTALLISTIVSTTKLSNSLKNDIYEKLHVSAKCLSEYYQYDIDHNISNMNTLYIDSLKDQDIELTLFKENERILTSIYKDNSNERNIGTIADSDIYNRVKSGEIVSSSNVNIGGNDYFVIYIPIYTSNGEFWGMSFAGTPEVKVNKVIYGSINVLSIIAILLLLVSIIFITLFAKNIKKSLSNSIEFLTILSTGNISVKNTELNNTSFIYEIDEIFRISNVLQQSLQTSINSVKESSYELTEAVDDVDVQTSSNVESISQISDAMNELSISSQNVSESAQNLAEKSIDIGDNIEALINNVNILINASDEIKKANEDATNYMNTVMDYSNKSSDVIDDISNKINDTNDAVKDITKVLDILEDISSETKLLSLNASIEAAHAGVHGKGFGVVANNIKELADLSSENVDKISDIILKIVNLSESSVNTVKDVKDIIELEQKCVIDTQDKFNVLSKNVETSITEINSIGDKTDILGNIRSELNDSTSSLSAISEELTASSQEVSATCINVLESCTNTRKRTDEMKQINEQLKSSVNVFS